MGAIWVSQFGQEETLSKKQISIDTDPLILVCVSSAFIGTFSHVLIDSIMHSDMQPFFPLAIENQVLLIVSIETLYKICIYTGLMGAVIFFAVRLFRSRSND